MGIICTAKSKNGTAEDLHEQYKPVSIARVTIGTARFKLELLKTANEEGTAKG